MLSRTPRPVTVPRLRRAVAYLYDRFMRPGMIEGNSTNRLAASLLIRLHVVNGTADFWGMSITPPSPAELPVSGIDWAGAEVDFTAHFSPPAEDGR